MIFQSIFLTILILIFRFFIVFYFFLSETSGLGKKRTEKGLRTKKINTSIQSLPSYQPSNDFDFLARYNIYRYLNPSDDALLSVANRSFNNSTTVVNDSGNNNNSITVNHNAIATTAVIDVGNSNINSLLESISQTESFLPGGKFSSRLKPIPGSTNGSFNPNAAANLVQVAGDSSGNVTASMSSLGSDQPSFGAFHITPVQMITDGNIGNNLQSTTNLLSMPDQLKEMLSGLDSSGNIRWNVELISKLGITLNGNIITSINQAAAQTLLGVQSLPPGWNPGDNILIGQPLNPFADKLLEILTLRNPLDQQISQQSLDSTYHATQDQVTNAMNAQSQITQEALAQYWNSYFRYSSSVDYTTLMNYIIGRDLTVLSLASSAYGTNQGQPLTFTLNISGFLAAAYIGGPLYAQNIANALTEAYSTHQQTSALIQGTTLYFNYVDDGNGNYHFTVDTSPINVNPSFPSIFHYMAYHGSAVPNLTDLDISTRWVSWDGYVMNGDIKTSILAFQGPINIVNPTVISYDSSHNYILNQSSGANDYIYLRPNITSTNTIISPTEGSTNLSYSTQDTIINMAAFNIPPSQQTNSSEFLSHFTIRYFSNGALNPNTVFSVAQVNSNPALIPNGQPYELLYFANLTGSSAVSATLDQTITPNFIISVSNPSSAGTSLTIFGERVTLDNFAFSTVNNNLINSTLDISQGTNVVAWLDNNISTVNMASGNNLIYGSDRSTLFYFNKDTLSDSNITLVNLRSDLSKISYLILPPSFNIGNLQFTNFSSYFNNASAADIYLPYSYSWTTSFQNNGNHFSFNMGLNGNYSYTDEQLYDLANLSLIENVMETSGGQLNITEDRSLVIQKDGSDIINISPNITYLNIQGDRAGDDTFIINPADSTSTVYISDFTTGDILDISNLINYNTSSIGDSISTLNSSTNDYVVNLGEQTLYIHSDHALTANDFTFHN